MIWMTLSLLAILSIIVAIIVSSNKGTHLSNGMFVVNTVDVLSLRFDKRLKSNSRPSLSKEMYPSSTSMTNSHDMNLFLQATKRFFSLMR